jgi:hypothetical protein
MEAALSTTQLSRVRRALGDALAVDDVNGIGLETGQSKRLRTVTPHRLLLAIVAALASSKVESLADLLREFNHQNGTTVAYKAFYNRLGQAAFANFMREIFCRLLGALSMRVLEPEGHRAVAAFQDIVIQDGSSFAVKKDLRDVFPGRFTTTEPAAVELHATFSGFHDSVLSVTLAPDCEAERQFLPDPTALSNRLLLADRGYPSVTYLAAVDASGGSFVMRLSRNSDPWVHRALADGNWLVLPRPIKLSQYVAKHRGCRSDLDVEFQAGHRFRIIVLPGHEPSMTRLCTNLPRHRFALDMVSRLYRFRWQVELCFKEWKSYANLHKFDTANQHIAEGLIWASLCVAVLKRFLAHAAQLVGGTPISTRRVAMCARHIIDEIATCLLACAGLTAALRRGLAYLSSNARRSNPMRDRRTGRLTAGLTAVLK